MRLSKVSQILGRGLESFFVREFNLLKSIQNLKEPSFFWTSTTALHQGLLLCRIAPASSINLRCFSHLINLWRLRNTGSNLSATAQPFVPLATSSNTAVRHLGAVNAPAPMPLPPPADPVTRPPRDATM